MAAVAQSAERARATQRSSALRNGALTTLLLLPAGLWYLILLVLPLLIVVVFSFGHSGPNGGYAPGFTFDNYATAVTKSGPFITSMWLAIAAIRSPRAPRPKVSYRSWT